MGSIDCPCLEYVVEFVNYGDYLAYLMMKKFNVFKEVVKLVNLARKVVNIKFKEKIEKDGA